MSNIIAIAAGWRHSLALRSDGTVWAWGFDAVGQLGDGTQGDSSCDCRTSPVEVTGLDGVTAIAVGDAHSLAVKSDGTVWAWGWDYFGQLGDGSNQAGFETRAVQVVGLHDVIEVAAGGNHSLALHATGTVSAWGENGVGELGNGTTEDSSIPVSVPSLNDVTGIAAGEFHSLAVSKAGGISSWGSNEFGQLGDGTTIDRKMPGTVRGLAGVKAIAAGSNHSLALLKNHAVWAWGQNGYHQLGDGTTTDRSQPVPVNESSKMIAISGGDTHSLALSEDGIVWSWGTTFGDSVPFEDVLERSGAPLGHELDQSIPQPVPRFGSATLISAGSQFSLATSSQNLAQAIP